MTSCQKQNDGGRSLQVLPVNTLSRYKTPSRSRNLAIMVVFFFLTQLIVWSPSTSALSGRATISNFQNGSTVLLDFNSATNFVETETFEILQNTTIQDAYFSIEYTATDSSPGEVSMDVVGTSNQDEWAYSGLGYGNLGAQTLFDDGTNSTLLSLSSSQPVLGPSFMLPTEANVVESNLSYSFYPDNEGLWNELGAIEDLIVADIDGDNLEEPIFLDTTGAVPRIGWIDYLTTSSTYSAVSWKSTCSEAEKLRWGDFNNDSRADIVTFGTTSSGQGVVCIHFSNTVTTLNNFFYLGSHAFSGDGIITDVVISDFTNDGYDDIIWANESSIGYAPYIPNYTIDPFGFEVVKLITVNGGLTGSTPTIIESITVGNYDGPNSNKSVAVGDANEWVSLHQLRNPGEFEQSSIGASRCGGQNLITTDVNGDNFDDILGWTNQSSAGTLASCTYLKDPSTYQFYYNTTSYFSPSGLGIGDLNFDGIQDMLVVEYLDPLDLDGNEFTLEGGLELRNSGSTDTFSTVVFSNFQPRTNPTNAQLGDLDGDGKDEMILLSGESDLGLFIDTLHQVNIDWNNDGVIDLQSSGFTRDAIGNGTHPIVNGDVNSQLTPTLITSMATYPSVTDSYGISMSTVDSTITAITDGDLELSNLSISYDAIFHIESFPGLMGNLSNILNQGMTMGTGNIPIDLSFQATKTGKMQITDLVVNYTLGAPTQPSTNPLVLNLTSSTWNSVEIGWTQVSPTQDTFIEYVVYRSETNDSNNLVQIASITDVNLSRYTDLSISENTVYWYAVIANFDYGYQTSLSNMLEVLVPSSYAVNGVTAIDQPNDQGGALFVSWDPVASSVVNGYEVYVSDYNFSDVSNLGSSVMVDSTYNEYLVTLTSEKYDESGNELEATGPIPDGVALWVAVVAVEAGGSFNPAVTAIGPVYSMNNDPLVTQISITILDDEGNVISPPVIDSSTPFTISAVLTGEGNPITGVPITINITEPGSSSNGVSYSDIITDDSGTVEQVIDWATHIHTLLNAFGGSVLITATYDGMAGSETIREQLEEEETLEAQIEVGGQFFIQGGNSWSVGQNGAISLEVRLLADNQDEQSLFDELNVKWLSSKDGNTISGGSVELDAFGQTSIEVSNMAQGGEVQIWIDTEEDLEDWMILDITTITVTLSEYQDGGGSLDPDADGVVGDADLCPATSFDERNNVDENGCGPSEQSQSLLAPDLSCENNWEIPNSPEQPTTSVTCTFTNTNSVYVSVSIDEWTLPDGMSIDVTCPTNPMALGPADGTISTATCTFYPTVTKDIPKSVDTPVSSTLSFNSSIQNAGGAGAGGYLDSIVTFEVTYNLIGAVYMSTNASVTDSGDTSDTNASQNTAVSSGLDIDFMKYAPIAGGSVLGLILLLVVVRLIRRRGDDDDDFDDDDDYGLFDEAPSSSGGLDNLLQGARPLITGASGRDQGRSMGKQMPTVDRDMGRSQESESYQEEEYGTTDEGYSVDEDGTEWWEDENGQWWYRAVDMEDWDAWNE